MFELIVGIVWLREFIGMYLSSGATMMAFNVVLETKRFSR